MAGYVIHIAIAKEYIKKHEKEIEEYDEFIKGVIAPDYIPKIDKRKNKNITHYGIWEKGISETHIDEFIKDKKVDMNKDYWKGYFIHLLTDHYFYNIAFKDEVEEEKKNKDGFYHDYDCINKALIEKYKIESIEEIKANMNHIDGKPKYLKLEKVIKFIDKISDMNLKEQEKLIKQKGMKGIIKK